MTRRRSKKRIVIFATMLLAVAGLSVLYFVQQRNEGSEYEYDELPLNTVLIQRAENEVVRVNFVHEGDYSYYMTPTGDEPGFMTWRLGQNPEFVLNLARAREKARLAWHMVVTDIAHETYEGLDLREFGLYPPLLAMEAVYYDGTTMRISFGMQTADTRHNFVMLEGDPAIYLIPSLFVERAQLDVAGLLDSRLPFFTWDAEYVLIAQRDTPVIELSVSYSPDILDEASATFMAASPGALFLRMLQPLEGRGLNHTHLDTNVMEPLNNLRISDVVSVAPQDLSIYGLDNPSLVFEYRSPSEEVKLLFGDIFTYQVGGQFVDFIYVMFADRPHVFKAQYEHVDVLFDLNVFLFIDRFISLIDIRDVLAITIDSVYEAHNYDMVLNTQPNNALIPSINDITIDEFDFRFLYRLLIALSADAEIEPFYPQGDADITVTFHRIDNPDTEVRFFAVDANFYAVSLNGAAAWFVTNSRAVHTFFAHVDGFIS